ncbi:MULTISPECIES: cytochrome c biogenesis protein CcsA [Pelosinus]|uniref:Cytochrome c assembly protein n=1 Tax=Pelosinus fermentans B4 TaxID=1149862 RepID=I9LC25_9FIRM|nr:MULTISPECIES: cytochrome c biogenesis protein CcsA [Pelosinus]EIW17974.1 cytochrome c assembly protein [Pelosinus fermentans B4]EIW23936.1 cytochrome c assembly protein [Pelosinus fermentans A11]OAM94859.1 cytochrome c assembly protein [Pelosinus fermentans DSM 17108]SDR19119.1 cytochrome c-type biogenesis protein CcmF [Pelosinus fermentans]
MVGYVSIVFALLVTCIASFSYFNVHLSNVTRRSGKGRAANVGLQCYRLSAILAGIAAGYLLYLILDNRFEYAYVFSYSSRELPFMYKLSAFWAGQQGSFMLWLVFHVIFGLLLSRKNDTPPGVMAVYSVLQAILLIVLLAKGPFMLLAQPQLDGVGLNPLLQDFWMIIHPPIIFLGYAGLAVPFAYALEGLFSNNHKTWMTAVLPWALFSWCALGAGVFIGGFWAYKVLGWGGYWAWDPVENSSLVPWLVNGALVHSLFWARLKSAAIRSAYFASIFSFVTVLYGTFLTRSGVLSDFSTHSFADEGVGGLLAGFVLLTIFFGLTLLIIRWPDLPKGELYTRVNSREFTLGCGVLIFSLMAVMVFIGMSTPLVTMLLGNPSNVSESFYNNTSLPLAAALVMLLTISPMFNKKPNEAISLKKYWWLGIIGLLSLVLPLKLGLYQPMIVITTIFSITALIANVIIGRGNESAASWPAAITHAGLAVMVIGIVASSAANESTVTTLNLQQPKQILGSEITYIGKEEANDGSGFYQKFIVGHQKIEPSLIQAFTKYNKEGQPSAREPAIDRRWLADLYVAPVMKHEDHTATEIRLATGEESQQNDVIIRFISWKMITGTTGQEMKVQTVFEVVKEGRTEAIQPELVYKNGVVTGAPVVVFGQYEIVINGVNPRDGNISIGLLDNVSISKSDSVEVEISNKPLINLVWLGAILITFGCGWGAINRFWFFKRKMDDKEKGSMSYF